MAFAAGQTPLPTDFFPGYTSDGTNISIPIASLPGLTAAEADAATGNGMEVVEKITTAAHQAIQAAPEADRPANMVVTQGSIDPQSTNTYRQDINFNFLKSLDVSSSNVVGESA